MVGFSGKRRLARAPISATATRMDMQLQNASRKLSMSRIYVCRRWRMHTVLSSGMLTARESHIYSWSLVLSDFTLHWLRLFSPRIANQRGPSARYKTHVLVVHAIPYIMLTNIVVGHATVLLKAGLDGFPCQFRGVYLESLVAHNNRLLEFEVVGKQGKVAHDDRQLAC